MSTSTTNILKSALRATAPIFVSPFHIDLSVLHSPLKVPYHYVQPGHGRPMEIRSRPYLLNLQIKAPGFGSIIHHALHPLRLYPHQVQAQGYFSIFQSRQVIFHIDSSMQSTLNAMAPAFAVCKDSSNVTHPSAPSTLSVSADSFVSPFNL